MARLSSLVSSLVEAEGTAESSRLRLVEQRSKETIDKAVRRSLTAHTQSHGTQLGSATSHVAHLAAVLAAAL